MVPKILDNVKRGFIKTFPQAFFYVYGAIRPYPKHFIVETTNICNLKCKGCNNPYLKREKRNMSIEEFKHILAQLKEIGVNHIDFDFCGEPLLNKDTLKMVKLAHDSGIKTFFSTNGTFIDQYVDDIIKSGLDEILIDLDAVESKSYLKLRVGGDFERVKNNIKLLCDKKNQMKSKKSHCRSRLSHNTLQ